MIDKGDDDESIDLGNRSDGFWCCGGSVRDEHLLCKWSDGDVYDLLLLRALHNDLFLSTLLSVGVETDR